SFTSVDDQTHTAASLDLVENRFVRAFEDTIAVPPELQDLPNMQGSGAVRDLQQAAALSTTLASTLEDYAAETTRAGQWAMLDDLIQDWADSSTFVNFVDRVEDMGEIGWENGYTYE